MSSSKPGTTPTMFPGGVSDDEYYDEEDDYDSEDEVNEKVS